jgi:hypothetical protein
MKFPFLVVLFFLSLLHATPSKPFVEDAKVALFKKELQEAATRADEFIIKPNEVDKALVWISEIKKAAEQDVITLDGEKKKMQQDISTIKMLIAMMNNPSQQQIQIEGKAYTRDQAMMRLGHMTQFFESKEDYIKKVEISLKNWAQDHLVVYTDPQVIENLNQLVLSFKNKRITEHQFLEKQKEPAIKRILIRIAFHTFTFSE